MEKLKEKKWIDFMRNSAIDFFLIEQKIKTYLDEDLGYGDITSNLLPNKEISAAIISKSNGIISGILEATVILKNFDIQIINSISDGDVIEKGTIIMEIKGDLRNILGIERTLLNIMMKMSSISTSTRKMVDEIKNQNLSTRIAASRKTTPGFRFFEKRAVSIGGGDTHRFCLDDMVLLKDTHLDAMEMESIHELIYFARNKISFSKKIEIEVEKKEDAISAVEAKADIIMLDNMNPSEIEEILKEIKNNRFKDQRIFPIFEASGNITSKNFLDYAKSGVDIVSTSEITLNPSIKIDLSLKIK